MAATEVVNVEQAQRQFVEMLPDIECIAGRAFSDLNLDAREEAVAEATALAWQNHMHCVAKEKGIRAPSLAHYAIQGVRSGRRFAGSSSTDVLSPRTQIIGRARVQSLNEAPLGGATEADESGWWNCSEGLIDRRLWECPPERVRIKLDYSGFLRQPEVTPQEREVFRLLTLGCGTGEIAQRLEVSAPRVCQVKLSIARKLVGFFGVGIEPGGRPRRTRAPRHIGRTRVAC